MAASTLTLSRTSDGVRIDSPRGPVHLQRQGTTIRAAYEGNQLVNGSAHAYARAVKAEVLEQLETRPAPWSAAPGGGLSIHDQSAFYQTLFDPAAAARDRIRFWLLDGAH